MFIRVSHFSARIGGDRRALTLGATTSKFLQLT